MPGLSLTAASLRSLQRVDLLGLLGLNLDVGAHIASTEGPLGRWRRKMLAVFAALKSLDVATARTVVNDHFASIGWRTKAASLFGHERAIVPWLDARTLHGRSPLFVLRVARLEPEVLKPNVRRSTCQGYGVTRSR
jgi:hypothetical protein